MKVLVVIAAFVACALASDQITHYYGHQVIRAFPNNREQFDAMHQLEEQGHLDFWTELRKDRPIDVMVAPHQMKAFRAHLLKNRITYEVLIADVEQTVVAEREQMAEANAKASGMNWDSYHRVGVLHEWLDELAAEYPNLITVENLGTSYRGNKLPLAKLSTGGSGKLAVWLDGNIHAREWISPATVTYILNELTTKSAQYAEILDRFDFYVMPSVNPDGYEWTHTNTRLWRKTRSDHASPLGCIGVDGNRNWGYNWGKPGASSDKCSDTYRGPSAFSEVENEILKNYIEASSANWVLFITFHSYGQYALLPYGDGTRPSDYADILAKANTFATTVQGVSGTRYSVGNSKDLLYETSGTSQDWAKGAGIFKYSYTFELRDTGSYGFQLPPAQIRPTGVETLAGLVAMLKTIN